MYQANLIQSLFILTSFTFWTIAYILIIKRGFQDKTFAMPITTACINISWEFIYAFIYPHPYPQFYADMFWFALDIIIVMQIFLYGHKEFKNLSARTFYSGIFLILTMSFIGVMLMQIDPELAGSEPYRALGITYGGLCSTYGDTLLISALYIAMLIRRNNVMGQSVYITIFRMIGTVVSEIALIIYLPISPFLYYIYASIFILDLIYLVLIYNKCKELNINPWRRW